MAVEEESVSLQDIIEEDQELESTANAVFGDSDDSKCSYSKVCLWWNHCALGQCLPPTQGYVGRQALYSCGTCMGKTNEPAGICLACSLHCHEGHELYELYTKRLFCCDCGNSKFQYFTCTLTPNKESLNSENKYNQNFKGLYCTCKRPYPDCEDDVEDEMIQCVVCEDWFHSRHLGSKAPPSYEEMVCGSCMESCDFLRLYQQCATPTKVVQEDEAASSNDTSLDVTNGPEPGLGAGNERSKESGSDAEGGSPDTSRGGVSCELARRRKTTLNQSTSSSVQRKAGYFDKNWRSQLCRCSTCTVLYQSSQCSFLLEESDSLTAYEERAQALPHSHDAAMAALGTIDRVQQVEAIHHYTELKAELSGFLNNFAQKRKVVSKEDIQGFFEGMEQRKQRRLETGEGVPPANCHF